MTTVLEDRIAVGADRILKNERKRQQLADGVETIRLWDGEWKLHHLLGNEYQHSFQWVSNDSGTGSFEVDFDSPQGIWLHDMYGRMERDEKRNVHITVDDPAGARWDGRLDNLIVSHKEDGQRVVTAEFLHSYEDLKWVTVWSNPLLPAAFQFPRAFIVAGPVTWILKFALFCNLFRFKNPLITLPDDPLDFGFYFDFLDMSTWDIVVKPTSFIEAMESGVVWGLVSSRFKNWHDMAHTMLEDAELSVECRRYLDGDPLPWEGANLRHGTLVVDIIDKSGVYVGTSNGGTLLDGLSRTVAEFFEDFIDSSLDLLNDTAAPQEYFIPGNRLTQKEMPGVVYLEGTGSGIETSDFITTPAKGDTVTVGGHSMPGINETISATIQAVYDILGNLIMIGSLGGTVDTLLQPLYEDTILAWWSMKSTQRAQNSGWSRYHEYFQEGAGKAYTISSLMVLRAGFWATKTTLSNKITISNQAPFLIGDREGHWFLDDRIGFNLQDDPTGRIWVDRARKIELKRDEDGKQWVATVGDDRMLQDPAVRSWGRIEQLVASIQELGVW